MIERNIQTVRGTHRVVLWQSDGRECDLRDHISAAWLCYLGRRRHSPAGKLRTPTPTTALTMLNISLLMLAVPPPSPPRIPTTTTSDSVARVVVDDDDGRDGSFVLLTLTDETPSRRGFLNATDADAPRRRASATVGAVAYRTRREHGMSFIVTMVVGVGVGVFVCSAFC